MKKKTFNTLAGFVCLMAFSIGIGIYTAQYYGVQQDPQIQGLMWPDSKQVVPFLTTDHTGQDFGLEQLLGKWSLIFFGYTHCPDVCPITLSVFKQVLEMNPDTQTQAIFVSVDPERDNIDRISEYVGYFHPEMIGLGGNQAQINSLTSQLGVVSMRGTDTGDGGYLVDHSASTFLIDPRGKLLTIFSAPHDAISMSDRLERIQDFINY
jgi:protein SCO1/2